MMTQKITLYKLVTLDDCGNPGLPIKWSFMASIQFQWLCSPIWVSRQ